MLHRLEVPSGCVLAAALLLATCAQDPPRESVRPVGPPVFAQSTATLLSGYFTENAGQVANDRVLYYGRAAGMDVAFEESAYRFRILSPMTTEEIRAVGDPDAAPASGKRDVVHVRISFADAGTVRPTARDETGHESNFILPGRGLGKQRRLSSYREMAYEGIYEGIDVRFLAVEEGLKYEVRLSPGADIRAFGMTFDGIEGLEIGPDGEMVIRTALGEIRDARPRAFVASGEIPVEFELLSSRCVGFRCDGWDGAETLVIDPLFWSTAGGGSGDEKGKAIAADANGHLFVAGETLSPDFPEVAGHAQVDLEGGWDCFVLKMNKNGKNLFWATYFGGTRDEFAYGIDVDGIGNSYVTGYSLSDDLPGPSGAYQDQFGGDPFDAFVVKLNSNGTSFDYVTYLGGTGRDAAFDIDVDAPGNAYVVGWTEAADFPTTGGAWRAGPLGGVRDAFAVKLTPDGANAYYSTYLGGLGGSDAAFGVAVRSGEAVVVGSTYSVDYSSMNGGVLAGPQGMGDIFITRLAPAGHQIVFNARIGGPDTDTARAVCIREGAGGIFVTGETKSQVGFPVTPLAKYQTFAGGLDDGFVLHLSWGGDTLHYLTYLGGSLLDEPKDIGVDGAGGVRVVGGTASNNFPTVPPGVSLGTYDSFLTWLDSTGSVVVRSEYLGGIGDNGAEGVVRTTTTSIVGWTTGPSFPETGGALENTPQQNSSLYVQSRGSWAQFLPTGAGWWKKVFPFWSSTELTLGAETYDGQALLELLETPKRGDASLILAYQLIPAKLNVANGADGKLVAPAIAEADRLLGAARGRLPLRLYPPEPGAQAMLDVKEILEDFNEGRLSP